MFYFDPLYFICMAPALLFSLVTSLVLKSWTNKYENTPNSRNLTGFEAMQKIVARYRFNISFNQTSRHLGDHFNPKTNTLVLSQSTAHRPTIAAIAITAHELGHVEQHQQSTLFLRIRSFLVPVTNIGTNLGIILIFIGILIAFTPLSWVGIIFFSTSVVFSLLTLPIEIDASSKGLKMIKELNLLYDNEIGGAKNVLTGAALTYVASVISSVSSLVYFFLRVQSGSRKK